MNIHVEWGIDALNKPSDITIIVDALSFSTAVNVAVSRGVKVYPFYFKDMARAFAKNLGVICAQKRDGGGISLSPNSLANLSNGQNIVLPSPNGASLSLFAKSGVTIAGCLRNAKAVANYVNQLGAKTIILVAAGERWVDTDRAMVDEAKIDNSLRPAFEDFIACGAIANYLQGALTPEAFIAKASFNAVEPNLSSHMLNCLSGQELVKRGFEIDVNWASELNISETIPILHNSGQTYGEFGVDDIKLKNQSVKYYTAAK